MTAPILMQVEVLEGGKPVAVSRFNSWTSGVSELYGPLIMWPESACAPLAVEGAVLRVTHADLRFTGEVVARQDDGVQVQVMLAEHQEPRPAAGPAYDRMLTQMEDE